MGEVHPPNTASQKLVERLGFLREGLLRSYEYFDGKFDDLYMYSLLKSDFTLEGIELTFLSK